MTSSTNQFQKPITTKINDAGNIEIGGCDLVSLAEKYSTPCMWLMKKLCVLFAEIIKSFCKISKDAHDVCVKSLMYKFNC